MANNKPFIVKSGLIPQTDNDQDLGGANNKFANAHISNLAGAVQINSAFTLPTSDGSSGNVLQTDGAGNITWADLAAVTFSDTAPGTPQAGDLWFDSGNTAELFIWTGSEWISATGGDQAAFTMRDFTGDGNTTAFDTSNPNNVSFFVYLNGILLKETNDYSVATGVITFVTAPALNDNIQVIIHGNAEYIDLSSYATISYVDSQIQSQDNTDEITEGSTNLYYTDARVQTKLSNVSGDIIPDTNIAYDLGSATNRFRDLYLSGNSIQLGTKTITEDNVPEVDLAIAPEILEIQVDAPAAGQDTAWLWTWLQSTLPYARRAITNSPEVSVPIYQQGTYTVNNYAAYDLHGSMTQTHTLYFKWIDGAGTDNLVSWVTSTGPVSDSHPDINGGTATDVQRLSISVPATVTPPALTPPSVSYAVTNNGTGAYTFSGSASGDNPNIGPFYRGGTYTFNVTATGHPFYLTTDNGTNFSAGTYFGEYTNGVTGSRSDSGTVTITVPADAPDTLYYQCGNHSVMRGAITVKDLVVETNVNGNYVIYAQHTQEGHKTPIEIRPIPSLVNQMCLVYDASVNKFVPQDLATYVENTPSFENKIREVAGTAELVVEDGSTVIAKVNVYDDSTYLPLTGNNAGDQAFATDTNILYIWDGSAWQQAGTTNSDDLTEGSTNLFYTNERVDDRVAALVVGGNNITATYDDVAGTLTLDGLPGYTDTDVGNYLTANGYDTATNIVASITDSAPSTLDTLNELAAALGDDPNFATTVTNNIATKAPINNPTFTGVISGDGSGITNLVFPATTNRYRYVATAGQTSFTATYTTGFVDVYLNGAKLDSATEFTDTSGTSIVLTTGANLNDIVEIIAYENFTVGDAVSASTGGTFNGPITATSFTGDLIGTASDSQLLDGLDSTSFLRSDVTSDTMNGLLVFSGNSGEITLTLGSKGSSGPLFPSLASNHASVIAEYELISSQVSANLVLDTGGLGKIKLETDTNITGQLRVNGNVVQDGATTDNFVVSQGTSTQSASVAMWGADHVNYPGQVHIVSRSSNASADSGKISFWDFTGSSFQRNVTIDKNGNVGIGTDAPAEKLHVTGTIRAGAAGNSSANEPALKVYASGVNPEQAVIAIQQGTTEGDTIIFGDFDPYIEYGINTDNGADTIDFTAGNSTGSIGVSKTLYNGNGDARTAHVKVRVDLNTGNLLVGGTVNSFKEYNTTLGITMGASNSSYTWNTGLPANVWVAMSVHVSSTDSDQDDHYDIKIGPNADYGSTWGDTYPSTNVPYGFGIVTHPGDSQGFAGGHYGLWAEVIAKTNSSGQLIFSIVGSNGGSGVTVRTKGYWVS